MKPNDPADVAILKAKIADHALMMKRLIKEAADARTQVHEELYLIDHLINMLFLASSGIEDEYRGMSFVL
ncbi:hypothetical protein HGO34_23325 [Agrobacterium vitis]|uniref:Uncharacterized protein n=1 Tax=Agrobacterium vitis TaxID=373 RepID=A0AAE4WHV0_AGRVI|nr:hypothetical protein [Agrobacterium vitis]MCF1500342.1 hypothetical protein [Allorhizobium sp. Av2]MBF2716833.1 hypothetical protein [Agrobacterium vitis]MCM2442635.1 hypothetical protein [Agrobacterium vitis]MUZ60405.1 hypothetical protein [Agrobacterium vitis]MUZ64059.1 hypothetical protein [Agrobacterium vitis]